MGITFHTQKENYVYHSKKRVMPGERISVKVEFATPPIEGIYFMVWTNYEKDGTTGVPEKQEA